MTNQNNIQQLKKVELIFHRLIIVDLTIRTIEHDVQKLDRLKINKPFILWYKKQQSELLNERKNLNSKLNNLGAKGDLSAKKEKDIQIYTFTFRGIIHHRRYFNIALRNHVEDELMIRLGLPPKSVIE